jgi:hypothetical protein
MMWRYVALAVGWVLVVAGSVLLVTPIPIPFIGIMPLLIGLALLSRHSKLVRRFLQYQRHRWAWLSRRFEDLHHRAPAMVKHMIRRTNPLARVRLARMRARHHRRH